MTSSSAGRYAVGRRLAQVLDPYQRRWSFCQNTGGAILVFSLIAPFVFFAVRYDLGFWSVFWRGLLVDVLIFLGFAILIHALLGGVLSYAGAKAFERAFPERKKEDRQMAVDILAQVNDPNGIEKMIYNRLPEVRLSLYMPPSAPPEQQLQKGLKTLSHESVDWPQAGQSVGDDETKPLGPANRGSPTKRGGTRVLLDTSKKLLKQGSRIVTPRKIIQLEPEKRKADKNRKSRAGTNPEKGVGG